MSKKLSVEQKKQKDELKKHIDEIARITGESPAQAATRLKQTFHTAEWIAWATGESAMDVLARMLTPGITPPTPPSAAARTGKLLVMPAARGKLLTMRRVA